MTGPTEAGARSEFVLEAVQRFPLLAELHRDASDSRELERTLSMSRSTIHRATRSLEEEGLLTKREDRFELTKLGRVVVDRLGELESDLGAARLLEPFLNTVEDPELVIPLEPFADATVTRRRPRQAHFGVKRIIDRIEATDSLRMFSSIISPLYVEVAHREIMEGTDIEVIFDAEILDVIFEAYRTEAMEALETGHFHLLVGDDIPFELFVFDDGMGMAAHDGDGIARAFVETDAPAAVEWAEDIYRTYEARSERVTPGARPSPLARNA